MKRLSWKYIAGLVDGEGCIDVQVTHNKGYPDKPYITPRFRLSLVRPSRFVLDMLKTNHGGSIWDTERSKLNPVWQDVNTWYLAGKKARPFLQNIVNHLEIKKEQARLAIWMIDHTMGKHVQQKVRDHLRDELKAMKRDPQRLSEKAIIKTQKMMEAIV